MYVYMGHIVRFVSGRVKIFALCLKQHTINRFCMVNLKNKTRAGDETIPEIG